MTWEKGCQAELTWSLKTATQRARSNHIGYEGEGRIDEIKRREREREREKGAEGKGERMG